MKRESGWFFPSCSVTSAVYTPGRASFVSISQPEFHQQCGIRELQHMDDVGNPWHWFLIIRHLRCSLSASLTLSG